MSPERKLRPSAQPAGGRTAGACAQDSPSTPLRLAEERTKTPPPGPRRYGPDGAPLRTLRAPGWPQTVALGRDWAVAGGVAEVFLLPTDGGPPRRFVPPHLPRGAAATLTPRIGGDGRTLWVHAGKLDRVDRYALP